MVFVATEVIGLRFLPDRTVLGPNVLFATLMAGAIVACSYLVWHRRMKASEVAEIARAAAGASGGAERAIEGDSPKAGPPARAD